MLIKTIKNTNRDKPILMFAQEVVEIKVVNIYLLNIFLNNEIFRIIVAQFGRTTCDDSFILVKD